MQEILGQYKVEWVNLNEGMNGDFDPTDNDDINLLRFDVYKLCENEWEPVDDCSYCTLMPANTPPDVLQKGLQLILAKIHGNNESLKKVCEELSYISPESITN